MTDWRVGYVLCVATGLVVLSSALLPWAHLEDTGREFTGLQLGMTLPLALVVLLGTALVTSGTLRTPWAAFVALGTTFGLAVVAMMLHTSLYEALTRAGIVLGGSSSHVDGYGVSVLIAGAAMALVSGVAIASEDAPGQLR